jgi:hypothetical protein
MAHKEQHVWYCDYCGERVVVEKDPNLRHGSAQAGIGRNYKPNKWGHITVTGLGEATVCPQCLADVQACCKALREG